LKAADTPVNYLEVSGAVHGFIRYPQASGTDEAMCAISQFVSGRPVGQVTLQSFKTYEQNLKREKKEIKRKNKGYISIESQ
jgi:acetyl esterase